MFPASTSHAPYPEGQDQQDQQEQKDQQDQQDQQAQQNQHGHLDPVTGKKRPPAVLTLPCGVCGGPAPDHKHFGGRE
jgi:hypothetical protein